MIALSFAALLLLIQYPLWLGKGGWLRVWELDRQVALVKGNNEKLKERNSKLDSEVQDLKNGTDAVEERARFELGMIKKNEIFVQILDPNSPASSASEPVSPTSGKPQ
nr:cell division protein FtsB [Undibacterium sp. TS12]